MCFDRLASPGKSPESVGGFCGHLDDVSYVDCAGRQQPTHRTSASPQCRGGSWTDVIVQQSTWRSYPDHLQLDVTN